MKTKRISAMIMSVIMLMTLCVSQAGITAYAAADVRVVVDGNELVTDQGAVIVDGRTLLPVRAVAEAVGADVDWNNSSQTATITTDDAVIKIKIGSYSLQKTADGETSSISTDVPAQIINGRTMVPIRVVAESLGLGVYWSQDAYTAYISSDGAEIIAQRAAAGTAGAAGYENLFDCNGATKWCVESFDLASVTVRLDTPVSITGYTLVTADDAATYPGKNPTAWALYGCNADSDLDAVSGDWQQLDYVNDDTFLPATNLAIVTRNLDEATPKYQYYKLLILDNGGDDAMQLSEFSVKYEGCNYNYFYEEIVEKVVKKTVYVDQNGNIIKSADEAQLVATYANEENDFVLKLVGDWDLITDEEYKQGLVDLFFDTYPRLYARFAEGNAPKTVTFMADKDYAGASGTIGETVRVSVDFANAYPEDLGYFSHELTHVAQGYSGKLVYGGDAWWTENMANYGGYRYYHWAKADVEEIQIHSASDEDLQDWGWQPYGNNSWFFAYMDYKYPTTKDSSGNLNYGLIDSINHLIKNNTSGEEYDDDPYDTSSEMNKLVKKITGYDCFESLRLQYVKELKAGTWSFTGFGNYSDNFITENLPGTVNPTYPKISG